jgi:hypothetical protein
MAQREECFRVLRDQVQHQHFRHSFRLLPVVFLHLLQHELSVRGDFGISESVAVRGIFEGLFTNSNETRKEFGYVVVIASEIVLFVDLSTMVMLVRIEDGEIERL